VTASGYTLDTNIVRPLLRNNPRVVDRFRRTIRDGGAIHLNALVYFETRRGLLAVDANAQLRQFDALCEQLGILPLDKQILDRASELYAQLRREGKLIEDADLLIAATALTHGLTLVTNNLGHFARVPDLITEDWLVPPGT